MPGSIITMKWPVGWVVLHENPDGSKVGTESADPNDHWRPWLEKHVGKQEWDWNWRLGRIAAFGSPAGYDTIEIKFRKAKAPQATLFRLKYSN